MTGRKYLVETKRYTDENGKTVFDSWVTEADLIEVKPQEQYILFFPIEGEHAGKKHYVPFSNIHVVREV